MAKQPTITIEMTPTEYAGIIDMYTTAVALSAKPSCWRMSEYVMTKVAAQYAVAMLNKQHEQAPGAYTLTFFDWSLMQGEIARLYMSYGDPEPDSLEEERKNSVLAWYALLYQRMKKNSRFDKMIRVLEAQEETRRKIDQAQHELEESQRRMWDLQQEACDLEHNGRKLGGTTND